MLTALIVEDEAAVRAFIKGALIKHGINCLEADNGITALELYEQNNPNIIFIDINIPKKNGIELAQDIFNINPWTYLIFCTGYAEYREAAFDVFAFDYITKPFTEQRVSRTIKRIIELEKEKSENKVNQSTKPKKMNRKMVETTEGFSFLNVNDIIFINKENKKTAIYYTEGKLLVEGSLDYYENALKDVDLFKTHEGFLVNIDYIQKIIPCGKSTYSLIMYNTSKQPLLNYEKLKELEDKMRL